MLAARWDPGADWESPTSLGFEQETLTAVTLGGCIPLFPEVVIHPTDLVRKMDDAWTILTRELQAAQRVLDAEAQEGFTFGNDFARDEIRMEVRVKTWEAIPGVTTPGPWEQDWAQRPCILPRSPGRSRRAPR
jgi:hypothetical protein